MDEIESKEVRLAVLIDADNISYHYIEPMMQEIARYGTPTIKGIYGDWTKPNLNGWKSLLLDYAISPVQQFAYTTGKNSTDSALIIDAMDILYAEKADAFCLVSSDSDFTRLAGRLREAGKTVYGIGEQKAPNAFIAACDRFIYLEILDQEDDEEESDEAGDEKAGSDRGEKAGSKSRISSRSKCSKENKEKPVNKGRQKRVLKKIDHRLLNLIDQSILDIEDDDGWAYLGDLGQLIGKKQPAFDSRNYGFAKLSTLIGSLEQYEMQYRDMPRGSGQEKQLFVRVKNDPTRIKKNERAF